MRAVLQRVTRAQVSVDGEVVAAIGPGLLVLLGVAADDTDTDADWTLDKLIALRIFEDQAGKFNKSLRDVQHELLVVSQFTLLADTRAGRRPSFTDAAPPERALLLYERVVQRARGSGVRVATGTFGARMQVELINDGPVTIILDSRQR